MTFQCPKCKKRFEGELYVKDEVELCPKCHTVWVTDTDEVYDIETDDWLMKRWIVREANNGRTTNP